MEEIVALDSSGHLVLAFAGYPLTKSRCGPISPLSHYLPVVVLQYIAAILAYSAKKDFKPQ
jgi:hypothetical protein